MTKIIRLQDSARFHARPASEVAKAASKYQSIIMISADQRIADAKQIFSMMRITVPQDNRIEVTVDGPDESQALEGMEEVFKTINW